MSPVANLRVGVIGTGFGARVVAPVFHETDGCEVVEVVTRARRRRRRRLVRADRRRSDLGAVAAVPAP